MKLFKVLLVDGRCEFVAAEDWLEIEGKYLFTVAGQPRGDEDHSPLVAMFTD